MSDIDNGIKQPLRFYDSVSKQNWRKAWVRDGGDIVGLDKFATIVCPENAIIPFQIRRRRSPALITTFDLYSWDDNLRDFVLYYDILATIPSPQTNHLKVIQLQTVDNIVWYPQADLTSMLPCGLHYVHLSDGTNNWYSEVFNVVSGWSDNTAATISIFSDATVTGSTDLSKDGTPGGAILSSNKPF